MARQLGGPLKRFQFSLRSLLLVALVASVTALGVKEYTYNADLARILIFTDEEIEKAQFEGSNGYALRSLQDMKTVGDSLERTPLLRDHDRQRFLARVNEQIRWLEVEVDEEAERMAQFNCGCHLQAISESDSEEDEIATIPTIKSSF